MADVFLPTTITIDGVEVPIRIARFDFESRNVFARDYNKLEGYKQRADALVKIALVKAGLPTKAELEIEPADVTAILALPLPKDATPEQLAQREALESDRAARVDRNLEKLRVHDENVTTALALRELEDTPAQREKREALEVETDRFASRFITETFDRFVSIEPTFVLTDPEGRRVESGRDLLRSYPTRSHLFYEVLYKVLMQNSLAAELKKKLASASASGPSSPEKSVTSPTASGDQPASTAGSASTSDSAVPAHATA